MHKSLINFPVDLYLPLVAFWQGLQTLVFYFVFHHSFVVWLNMIYYPACLPTRYILPFFRVLQMYLMLLVLLFIFKKTVLIIYGFVVFYSVVIL